jgi:hypothetical protein
MGLFGTSFSFTGSRETVAQSLKDFKELDSELSCAPPQLPPRRRSASAPLPRDLAEPVLPS